MPSTQKNVELLEQAESHIQAAIDHLLQLTGLIHWKAAASLQGRLEIAEEDAHTLLIVELGQSQEKEIKTKIQHKRKGMMR